MKPIIFIININFTFLSSFKGAHPCFCLYSLCFFSASSSNSSSSSDEEEDEEEDFVLGLDFWNDDVDEGCRAFEFDDLKLESKSGNELNLLSNPEPNPEASESSFISL